MAGVGAGCERGDELNLVDGICPGTRDAGSLSAVVQFERVCLRGLNESQDVPLLVMTLELPQELAEAAERAAAKDGRSVSDWILSLVRERTAQSSQEFAPDDRPWLRLAGVMGKTNEDREEMARIRNAIEEEFRRIDPLER